MVGWNRAISRERPTGDIDVTNGQLHIDAHCQGEVAGAEKSLRGGREQHVRPQGMDGVVHGSFAGSVNRNFATSSDHEKDALTGMDSSPSGPSSDLGEGTGMFSCRGKVMGARGRLPVRIPKM